MKGFYGLIVLLTVGVIFSSTTSYAVTAYPYPVEYTLPDGKTLTIYLKGDEKVKWAETPDGWSILLNSSGFYEYAVMDGRGDMVPSGIRVNKEDERSDAEKKLLESLPKGLRYSKSQIGMMKQIWEIRVKEGQKAFPTTGSRKLVCILMAFTDKSFTKTQSDFNNLFNQVGYTTGGALGSIKDYFKEVSYSQFDLTVTVAGPYTAANNMAYYGTNDAQGNDLRPDVLVTEAVNAANAAVNYADFDNDNDGNVDGIYVIYAGYGEEAGAPGTCIWAHQWEISPVTLDGKVITTYSCSPELRGISGTNITRIGVICHEFGHVLGAPDFYDTDYATGGEYDGMGEWDLQAGGSWNNYGISPAHPNAYTKVYIYNWASATTISSAISLTLNNSAQYSTSFYRYNTATSNEYFLLENRQQVGFDTYVPGHGMLIYHVDGTYISSHTGSNNINAGSHQGLYPMSAVSTATNGIHLASANKINITGCPWPGTSSKTSFTDATTPCSKSWLLANTNKPITSITENNTLKTISFDFMGGGAVPTITVSVSSLNFEEVYTGKTSRPQSYTVTGTNLTANITVTPPTGVEVSSSCSSGYGSSLVLTQSGGSVNATVYARYTSGNVSGNITHTSTGATTKNVSISETATATNLPGSYYSTATGVGATLKTNLYNIIKNHTQRSYNQLWTDFQTTDDRPDGKVWDIYTDIICGTPCSFTFVTDQDDGTGGTAECQKYNREHTFPKSWFGGDVAPMYTDLFHLMPADKYINNQRGNYAFGVVTTGTTFNNGSQLGTNTYSGGPSATVYEPADDYKGDLARAYFYMATRYEDVIAGWEANDANGDFMLDGSAFPCFETWTVNMLLEWHNADPVDQKELSRNDAVYTLQGNRNPFIDHPEYVSLIWGSNPVLSVSPSTLSGFSYVQGSGPSASQSYTVSGSNLTGSGNITVTGSTNYEVSTDNSTFSGSVNLPYAGGIITGQPKTVYVRLKAGLSAANYNGETISNAGGGATTVNVTCYGQVTSGGGSTGVFSDDFSTIKDANYTTTGQIGTSAWSVNRSGADFGARRNTSPEQLELTNDVGGTANAAGWCFAYVTISSSFSSPYNATLSSNPGLVTWTFNMRQIRTDPAGFTSGNYGVAFILAGSSTTPYNAGSGYAVVLGQSGGTDPVRLAKYNNGLSGTLTDIKISNTSGLTDFGVEYLSVKVTYTPSTNTWELFLRNDGASAFADPVSGTLTSQGTVVDNTYTGTSLGYMGAYWAGSTTNNQTAFFDNTVVTVAGGSSSPTITLSASSLTGFTYMYGYGPSSSQTYNLMGSNLTPASGDLTVTGSTNYEVSTNNSTFESSRTVSYTGGSLTATPIYIRLKEGLTVGNYNSQTIANWGGGATTQNVTCSGTVTAVPDPSITISATSLAFGDECTGNISDEQSFTVSGIYLTANLKVTCPDGYEISTGTGASFSGNDTVILAPVSGSVPVTDIFVRFIPSSAQSYTGNIKNESTGATTRNVALTGNGVDLPPSVGNPASGSYTLTSAVAGGTITSIGCATVTERGVFYSTTSGFNYTTGTKVSESGTYSTGAFTVSLTGLSSATTYYFIAFARNSIDTSFTVQGSFTTVKPEPSQYPTAFDATTRSSSQIDVTWTDAGGTILPTGYLIKVSSTDSFEDPVDGTDPGEDTDFSDGSGLVKVLHGTGASYSFTGLNASTTYYFHIWSYTNSGTNINFKTGSEPTDNAVTQSASSSPVATWVLITNGVASSVNANITAGNFTGGTGIGTLTFSSSGAYANSWTTATSPDATDYYQVTLAPKSGYMMNVYTINFGERRSSTGIRNYQVRWSKNADFSSPVTISTVNVPDNENERTGNITGLDIAVGDGETIYIRWYGYGAEAGTGTWRINDNTLIVEGVVSAAGPNISVAPSVLTGFSYIYQNGPSSEQNFSISGSNLTGNISIAPPTHFEISTQTGGSFTPTNPVTLTQSGGTVGNTTIYVRLTSGLATGDYNSEDITASSSGATNKTVTCSGTVNPQVPDISTSTTSLTGFSCVSGNASTSQNYTVSADYLTADVTVTAPDDFEVSTDNVSFSASVVLTQSGGNITGEPKTVYTRIKASAPAGTKTGNITHTSSGATTRNVSVGGSVLKPEPANQPTAMSASPVSASQISLSWTDAETGSQAPDYYLILANTTGTFTPPSDGTDPATDNNMGDGSGTFKVAHGTQLLSVTGLTANTLYYFKMWPYTNSGTSINFKTDGTVQTSNATTLAEAPSCASDLIISEYYEGASNDKYLEIYNNTGASINLAGYKLSIYFNGSTSATDVALSGTIANKSVFIIANAASNSTILAAANATSTGITFNGNDAVALRTTGNNIVDVIGKIGEDPSSQWGSGYTSTEDNTLVRKNAVTAGDTDGSNSFDPATEWDGYVNTTAYMGSHSMDCTVDPEPTNQVTNFAVGTVTTSAIPLSWTAAETGSQAPDGYLVKLNVGTVEDPVDGTDPANVTAITSGAANVKVTPGTATSASSFTSMTAGTMYNYKIYSYTNAGIYINFNVNSPPAINHATLPAAVTGPGVTITGSTTATIGWTKPGTYSDANHSTLVFVKAGSAVTAGTPTNAPSTYTPNTAFSSGTPFQADGAAYCVYNGDGNSVSITNLSPLTTYYVRILTVVDAANSNATCSYSAGATANGTTAKAEPANQPTGLDAVANNSSQITLTWTDAIAGSQAPDNYLILAKTTNNFTAPVDGTDPTADSDMGDGSGVFKVAHGVQTKVITGLTSGTKYYFKMWSYTNSGTLINFKTDGTVQNDSATTDAAPAACATDLIISEYVEGSSNNKYIEIYNGTSSGIDLSGYKLQFFANGASSPNQDIALSGILSAGSTIVYKNSLATIYGGAATTNAAVAFSGNDALVLYKVSTSSYVDIFGRIGEDPGTAWTSGSHSTVDKTLVRKSTVTSGITTNPSSGFPTLSTEWDYYNTDDVSHLGSHTMFCGYTAPAISAHPSGQTKCAGENASFSITASGTITAYQWMVNTGDGTWTNLSDNAVYGGATTSSLSITGVTTAMNNYQFCAKVNNQTCSTYSNAAKLTVNPRPAEPLIAVTSNQCGKTVLTRGTPADGLAWYWQGTNATGTATSDNALSDTVLQGNDGTYYLRACYTASGCWSETSASQPVTVNIKPVVTVDNAIAGCGEGSISVTSDQNAQQTFELLDQNGDPLSPAKLWSGIADSKTFEGVATGNYKARVILENNCASDLPVSGLTLTNNPIVPEPSLSDAYRCGSGTITLTAIASSGNQMQFFEHKTTIPDAATTPTSTDNSEPWQHTTASLINPDTTRVWARMYNSVTGCKSNWIVATATTSGERGLWTGAGTDSYWTTTDNWSDCTVPLVADDVIIPTGRTVVINSDVVCHNINVDGGAAFTVENGHSITVSGNLAFSASATITLTGALELAGSTQQTISGGTITAGSLTINNSSGIVANANLVVEGTLTLSAGILTLNNTTLTIGTNSTSRGNITGTFGSSCYIAAYKTGSSTAGKVKRYVANGNSFLFPVGDNDEYSPFTIAFTSGTFNGNANIEVFVADELHPQMISNTPTWYITRYWKYEPEGITAAVYNLDITYHDADVYIGTDLLSYVKQHIYPLKYSPTGWIASRCASDPTYHFSDQFGQGTGSNNGGTNTLSWTGVYSFSEVTGGGGSGGPLPVDLLYFNALPHNGKVILNWATASESNNAYFTLKRAADARHFEEFAIVAGQGNSFSCIKYDYTDEMPLPGLSYYQLCQTDFDGLTRCPAIASVKTTNPENEIFYFTFKETEAISIGSTSSFEGNYQVDIFDPSGNHISKHEFNCHQQAAVHLDVNLVKGGLYCIRIMHNNKMAILKLIY